MGFSSQLKTVFHAVDEGKKFYLKKCFYFFNLKKNTEDHLNQLNE